MFNENGNKLLTRQIKEYLTRYIPTPAHLIKFN